MNREILLNKYNHKLYLKRESNIHLIGSKLTPISPHQAQTIIKEYNVYYSTFCQYLNDFKIQRQSKTANQDINIYQFDNLISFDEQYEDIKKVNFPHPSNIFIYTDYQQNPQLIQQKIKQAHIDLKNKKQTVTANKLKVATKLKKEDCEYYIKSLEKNQTMSLFDLELQSQGCQNAS
jgi:lipopolysaccharide export LptBFGC system permease protein LptF